MSSAADELRIKLSFRVMGHELDPEGVSNALRLQPTVSHRRGDPHVGKSGRRYGTFREGLWMLTSKANPEADLQTHLADLFQQLSGRESVLRQFRDNSLRTDLFVGVFGITDSCGFSLSPEQARAIAEFGLTIGFDLYPASEEATTSTTNVESRV